MPRAPQFDQAQILDAAERLIARHGPSGATIGAIAQAVGAPTGSIYHRFDSRDVLLAEVWLRAAAAFQAAFFERLAGPAREAGLAPRWPWRSGSASARVRRGCPASSAGGLRRSRLASEHAPPGGAARAPWKPVRAFSSRLATARMPEPSEVSRMPGGGPCCGVRSRGREEVIPYVDGLIRPCRP
jgi:AcrR family transcriptional regulator